MSTGNGPRSPSGLAAQTLDRYQIDTLIGRGGMAEVFRGRLQRMGGFQREVAVKVLLPHLAGESQFVNMLLDEARIAATICHPNVVQMLDVGQEGEIFYLVMELVDGIDLRRIERRHERGRVPLEPCLYIIAEVLRGLQAIHEARDGQGRLLQIVHRDVTPSNVLLTQSGAVKLADFGIAHATGRLTQTQHGAVKGKTRYMAPEQLGGRVIDCRTDLFAVGVLLLEAVAGRDAQEAWHMSAMGPLFKIPAVLPQGLPADVTAILQRALSGDQHERYQTAAVFRREVQTALVSRAPGYGADELAEFVQRVMWLPELKAGAPEREPAERDEDPLRSEPVRAYSGARRDPTSSPPPRPGSLEIRGAGAARRDPTGTPARAHLATGPANSATGPANSATGPANSATGASNPGIPAGIGMSSGGGVPDSGAEMGDSGATVEKSLEGLLAAGEASTAPGGPIVGPPTVQMPTVPKGLAAAPPAGSSAGTNSMFSTTVSLELRNFDLDGGGDGQSESLASMTDDPVDRSAVTTITRSPMQPELPQEAPVPPQQQPMASAGRGHTGVVRLHSQGFRTTVRSLQQTIVRVRGPRWPQIPTRQLSVLLAGLTLAGLGVLVVYRVQGGRHQQGPEVTAPEQPGTTPEQPTRVDAAVVKQTGQLLIAAPLGTRVVIDGAPQAAGGGSYTLSPGPHTVRLGPPRRREIVRTVEVRSGEQVKLVL